MKGGTTTAGIMRPPDGWAWLLRKARKAFGTSMFGVSLRAPLLITKSRCLSPRSPPMAQIDGRLPWRMCAAESGVELATAAGCTTRGRAPLARHSPCRKDNDEWSFAINVEKGKMVLASHTAAVVGERGVRAPRAAALGRSPRPLLRGSSKERCLALKWWVLRCPEASQQVCLASRSAPGVTPWRRQQVGSGAAPRAVRRLTSSAAFDHEEPLPFTTKPAHGAGRWPASMTHVRRGVGRRARRSRRLPHARPRASYEPSTAPEAQQREQLRKRRRGGKAEARLPRHSGRGRAGRVRAAHRRFGRIARAPPPQIAAGERVGVKMLGEKMLSVLAKSLSDSTSGVRPRAS
eukprot:CAMPEP_0185344892 /NCGR_PEP_ID=MMETSP1363-20130426/100351_1 /TAXON_ID=38817 /ORGANISM="Gephyrocapsa oceanica, Strain RCC1303" /LENGTH=347 /DNA_ID=CAMNT_0027944119 /DNA_START=11 /DNA_END=1050 /DNA_ORIENTATION=-